MMLFFISAQPTFAKVIGEIGSVPIKQNVNVLKNIYQNLISSNSNGEIIISRPTMVMSYDHVRRALNWSAWRITAQDLGTIPRSNQFKMDMELQTYLNQNFPNEKAVSEFDYIHSCYDRGHTTPSGDRTATLAANIETFKMSNMHPQTPYLNRVIWAHLELYTRDLILNQKKKVYVVAGPIFDEDFGNIGPEHDIKVPSKFFKIIFIYDQFENEQTAKPHILGAIMPNRLENGDAPDKNQAELCKSGKVYGKPEPATDWIRYSKNLKEIEAAAHLKLSPTNYSAWTISSSSSPRLIQKIRGDQSTLYQGQE